MRVTALTRALLAAGAIHFAGVAAAANHPFSEERHDAATGITTINLTMGLDWDVDNPVPADRNRTYVNDMVREFAKSLYLMSNGKHRVGVVRVYKKSRYLDNVDAQMLNKDGRANASINGWGNRGNTSTMFATMDNRAETVVQLGKTIAHEFGHYGYGLFDEYVEAGSTATQPSSPQANDTPRNTMMNNHEQFPGLSTPTDYTDPAQRKTAHYRMYEKSAWEVLTGDPANDATQARDSGWPKRTYWQAFRNLPPTSFGTLSSDAGYDAALSIVHMPDNTTRQVLIVDRTLPADLLAAAKRSAEQLLRKTENDARVAVIAYPEQISSPVSGFVALTDEVRTSLIAAINGITANVGTATADDALTGALAMLQTGRSDTDTPGMTIFTSNNTQVANATTAAIRAARVSVQPVTVDTPAAAAAQYKRGAELGVNLRKAQAGKDLLRTLAETTGGVYRHANNAAEMTALASKSAASSTGAQDAVIREGELSALSAGASHEASFVVSGAEIDGPVKVTLWTSPADYSKLQWALVSPAGAVLQSPLPTGFALVEQVSEGARTITIPTAYAGRAGTWKLRLTAGSAMTDALAYDATTTTLLTVEPDTLGGTNDDPRPLVLQVTLKGPQAVTGARVVADIYSDSGTLLYAGVPLRDDGLGVDHRADDGIYTLAVGDGLAQGEYVAIVRVDNPDGTARLSTVGALRKGSNAADIALPNFSRSEELYFAKELAGSPSSATRVTMTEYRYAPLDYYFITSRDSDKTILDSAAGWARTGQSFSTFVGNTFGTGGVNRYYFDKVARSQTRGSHFYTMLDNEKKLLAGANPGNSQAPGKPYNEGVDSWVFFPLVEGVGGSCVAGQKPVYRVFRGNARFPDDPNHRYTTDITVYNSMVGLGWDGEGVKFCVPQ